MNELPYSGLDYHWTKNYKKICLDVRVVSLMKEKTGIKVKKIKTIILNFFLFDDFFE